MFSRYIVLNFIKHLSNDIACSKAARFCHLVRIDDRRQTTVAVGEIGNVPFVKNNDVAELPRYIAAVDGSDADVDTVELWTRHQRDLSS